MKILKTTKCWICDNDYVNGNVKVRDYRHVTGQAKTSFIVR